MINCLIFMQAYLWENNEPVVEWLENQKKSDSTVSRNIYAVKKDAIISQIQKALEVSFVNKKKKQCSS